VAIAIRCRFEATASTFCLDFQIGQRTNTRDVVFVDSEFASEMLNTTKDTQLWLAVVERSN
jgi:hypothetical protein